MVNVQRIRQIGGGGGGLSFVGRRREENLGLGHVGLFVLHSSGSKCFSVSFLFTFEGREQY